MKNTKATELDRGLLGIKYILPNGKFEEKEKEIIDFLSPHGVYHPPLADQLYSVLSMGNDLEDAMRMVLMIRQIVIGMARIGDISLSFYDVQNVLSLKVDAEEREKMRGAGIGPVEVEK